MNIIADRTGQRHYWLPLNAQTLCGTIVTDDAGWNAIDSVEAFTSPGSWVCPFCVVNADTLRRVAGV